MYKRQLLSTLTLITLCFVLLGTGFFSLYYQYHLTEMKKLIQKDVQYISSYAQNVLQTDGDIQNENFLLYLRSVSMISSTTILLSDPDGNILYATGETLNTSEDVPSSVPEELVSDTQYQQTFTGLTTFDGIFTDSSYVTGVPIIAIHNIVGSQGSSSVEVPLGLIFVAADASYVKDFLYSALQMFLSSAAAVLLLSIIFCTFTSQHVIQPIRTISDAVYRFAHGDLDTRIPDNPPRKDEIGDLSRAFNTMAESIAQAEDKRSEFIANVSHELKTPMTTIAGFADGILDGTIPPNREKESLEIISSETRRLSRLIRRMLELSRLQSQERIAAQVQFDVSELLIRTLLSLESKVTGKNLEVDANLPEHGAMVWGEPDAITQVCYNLLDNAIKFSKEGGTLSLSIASKGGKTHISISNEGETIPPHQLPQIFERFHKTDVSRTDKEGVGLGLYIVKTLLDTYKESITVESENGKTTFTFTLSEV